MVVQGTCFLFNIDQMVVRYLKNSLDIHIRYLYSKLQDHTKLQDHRFLRSDVTILQFIVIIIAKQTKCNSINTVALITASLAILTLPFHYL